MIWIILKKQVDWAAVIILQLFVFQTKYLRQIIA
jgi:hypothetical protein